MDAQRKTTDKPTRRQFVRRTLAGASLLGLGSATGLLADGSSKTSPKPRQGKPLDKQYTYDLSGLTKVDPSLIRFEETRPIASGFEELRSIVLSQEGKLYVAGDQSIKIFTSEGAPASEIRLDDRPRCLAIAKDGLLYVGMTRHVEVFDANGTRKAKWDSLGSNAVITSLAVADQKVLVADAGNRVVVRYDDSGRQLGLIGKKNPTKNVLGFVVPSPYFEVGVDPEGLVWVVNPAHHRIESYTLEGEFRSAWGEFSNDIAGFCGCCNPVHFTRLGDGRFVTSEKGLPRVKVYSAKGEFEGVVAAPDLFPQQLANPRATKPCMALAADAKGRVFLADATTREVRVFSPKPA